MLTDFQAFGDGPTEYEYSQYYSQSLDNNAINPNMEPNKLDYSDVFPSNSNQTIADDFDEPPLLEELEIYPDRIVEKMIAVLNPFRAHSLADDADFLTEGTDLAGPLSFCIILALCLFVSGSKVYFGYIYGLSVMSCLMMYCLLSLMTTANIFTLANVTSILGYSLLPIVGLSILGLFISLHGYFGILSASVSVIWSSLAASRLFIAISGDGNQRPLIAYPCALVSGVFALLVIF